MKKDLEGKLFKEFSWTTPVPGTLMDFGFCFRDGWFKLVYKLCANIQKEISKDKKLQGEGLPRLFQSKEKFGGLRYYLSHGNKKIWKLINEAEAKSYEICEVCGKKGTLRDLYWIQTLCEKHFTEAIKKLKK